MDDQTLGWTVMSGIVGVMALINAAIVKPIRDRVNKIETKTDDLFTKQETVDQIDQRLVPFEQSVNTLTQTIRTLTVSVDHLSDNVNDLRMWQQREIGRGERSNGERNP